MKLKLATFILLLFTLTSCQVGRYVFYNFADINDHKKFPKRNLKESKEPFMFHQVENSPFKGEFTYKEKNIKLDDFLAKNKTVSFLVIRNDSILYENYFKGYDKNDVVPSFSMAKSITSALIGCAIEDGKIISVDDPIVIYLPELKNRGFDNVKIYHLLQMTSGLDFNESYHNPFGDAAEFYYGTNLRKSIAKMKTKSEPGIKFEYQSGNTQLLGLILERSLKDQTVTEYLQEKIWTPLGMETPASWSIDRRINGLEKTFCCINATARDFAKFGRLYLNKGYWNGSPVIPYNWVVNSTQPDKDNVSPDYYQYQWWFPNPGKDFLAQGILGQFIYVNPSKNLIIVRQGSDYGNVSWWRFFTDLSKSL